MRDTISVFVSSVIRENELAEERQLAKSAINSTEACRAWLFEDGAASSVEVTKDYLTRVAHSDILIQLLHESITEPVIEEYRVARENDVPCLVFIKKPTQRSNELQRYLDEQIDRRWRDFTSAEQLMCEIRRAIAAEIARKFESRGSDSRVSVSSRKIRAHNMNIARVIGPRPSRTGRASTKVDVDAEEIESNCLNVADTIRPEE